MKTKLLIAMLVCGIAATSNAQQFRLLTLESQSNEIEPQVSILWLCVAGTFTAVVGYMVYELYHCAKTKLGPPTGTNTNASAFSYTGPASDIGTNGSTVIHFEWTTNFINWFYAGSTTGRIDNYYFIGTNHFMNDCFFRAWY